MDVIDVPEVTQLPELSGEEESPRAFADMVLTCTRKQLDARLSGWLFKFVTAPLLLIAPYLRTNYWLHGDLFTFKRPFRKPVCLSIDEFDEIGVETTDEGPFVEDVFWILKRGDLRLRIGEPHPVFKMLMDRFGSLKGFDWQPFVEAQSCTENRYFRCWRRAHEFA